MTTRSISSSRIGHPTRSRSPIETLSGAIIPDGDISDALEDVEYALGEIRAAYAGDEDGD